MESNLEALLAHESECYLYKVIPCSDITNCYCNAKVIFLDFLEHIEQNMESHKIETISEDMIAKVDASYDRKAKLIRKFDKTFFFVQKN